MYISMDNERPNAPLNTTSNDPNSRDVEEEQTQEYSEAVGCGISKEATIELQNFLQDASPFKSYASHSEVRFIYEILYKSGWVGKVKRVVDAWIEVRGFVFNSICDIEGMLQDNSSLQRAAKHVGRPTCESKTSLLRGFCVFRLKAIGGHGWTTIQDSLGIDQHQPQTVVFIALEDLDSKNGFFMNLKQGSDVCLDSRAKVRFPSTGGGIGIFLALNL